MTKVAVNGAGGRMGQKVISLVAENDDCDLTCALEDSGHAKIGIDAGEFVGAGHLGIPLGYELSKDVDVLIDFSAPQATLDRARECVQNGIAMVIGTTGFSADERSELEETAAQKVPVLIAPNMGLGVNLLFGLVGEVARALGEDYDVEIIETHHRRKKDAPSGTAGKLAENICEAQGWDPDDAVVYGREGLTGERPSNQLGIHAVRGGGVVGEHTVIFAAEGERIELTHRAQGRDLFAQGAVRAALFLADQPAGLYDMEDVLF